MKKGLAGLALLLGGCVNTDTVVPLNATTSLIIPAQTGSLRYQVCLETDNLRYSVADGFIMMEQHTDLLKRQGYGVYPEGNPHFKSTEKGWSLCSNYFLIKK
ncbi:MAG: hypothetical protein AABX31_01845 [Nanoarchaeota archaeon]